MMLASVGDDVGLWDIATWSSWRQFNPHSNNVSAVSWTSDGSCFGTVSANDDKISLNYVQNNTFTTSEIENQSGQLCLDFSCNGKFLVTGSSSCVVNVWDIKGKKLKTAFKEHKGPVSCTQFNWNDSYIASGSETGEIILHNFVTGQSSSPLVAPKVEAIRQLQYSSYRKSLLGSASDDGSVNLWDTNTRRLLHSFSKVHVAPTTGLVFSPLNEMFMLSVGLDQKLICYDLDRKKTLKVITAESPLTSVDMMDNGGTVAVGSTRGKIFIYDLRQRGCPVRSFTAHKSSVQGLRFQPSVAVKKMEANTSASRSNHRQLPTAPQRNVETTWSSTNKPEDGVEKQTSGITTAAIVDVVSPLRDVDPTLDMRSDGINRSGGVHFGSSLQNDSSQGLFSPLSNSLGLCSTGDSSVFRRHNTSDRANSGLVHGTGLHCQGDGSPVLNAPYTSRNSLQDANYRTLANGHSGFHSPYQKRSPKDVCASPNLAVTQRRELALSSADGAVGEVTESNPATCTSVERESPPHMGHTSSRVVDPRLLSPNGTATNPTQLRSLVREAIRDYSEQMQGELKTMFRKATRSPKHSDGHATHEASVFQSEFIRNLIREALDDFREEIHKDLQSVHLEILRQFQFQQAELVTMLERYSVNRDLIAEVERLREENRRLKKSF